MEPDGLPIDISELPANECLGDAEPEVLPRDVDIAGLSCGLPRDASELHAEVSSDPLGSSWGLLVVALEPE